MSDPYAPAPDGYGVPSATRAWYRAPGSLVGAASFSAVFAWATIAAILCGWVLVHRTHPTSIFDVLFWLFGVGLLVLLLVVVGTLTFWLTVAGAVATIPLAVTWYRSGDRTPAAVAAVAHAAFTWVVLAFLVLRLGLTSWL